MLVLKLNLAKSAGLSRKLDLEFQSDVWERDKGFWGERKRL